LKTKEPPPFSQPLVLEWGKPKQRSYSNTES
jgi:hypothetical protein